jgi:RNA polymerase sigma-70 factor (ECF subfamily)
MDPPGELTVADLLAQARLGDQAGRDRLFAACRGYLQMVAHAQVDDWMRAKVDSSDLVQQTLLEAHRDFARFEGRTTAEWLAWLKRIMAHNAADAVRHYRGTAKRQARRELSLDQHADEDGNGRIDPAADDPTPSQEFLVRDTELRVAAALAQLTDDHRRVIVLRNLQRLPFDEVAQRLGRTRPAAQMLWMRAVKKLQEQLAECD